MFLQTNRIEWWTPNAGVFLHYPVHKEKKTIMKRQELNFSEEITSQQRLHTCLTPVAVLWLIWINYKCHEYLNFGTSQAFFRQKEWFSSVTVCCCQVDSRWNRGWGLCKVLSSVPSHVLAAGGHILDPLVCHKTKGKAVETRPGCLPVWEILHWIHNHDFGKKILALFCPLPEGFFIPLPQCSGNRELLKFKSLSFKSKKWHLGILLK